MGPTYTLVNIKMHLIHWKKFGILVPVLTLGGIFSAAALLKLCRVSYGRWESFTMFLPALLLFIVGWWLDRKGQPNEFCFFPMRIWSVLLFIFGIVILVKG